MRFWLWIATGSFAILATACSSPSVEQSIAPPPPAWSPVAASNGAHNSNRQDKPASPRIVAGSPGLQCVPYAREKSGIPIRGDAWTWWGKADGKYQRSGRPAVGAVLVVGKTRKNKYGHLAVVTRIVSDREIIVNHANWLNKGRIHLDTPVRDVSSRNDWSQVKFWYTPGNVLGKSAYPVSGFIYPKQKVATSG
jgi:surface antigen